ncbi:hypothetical protein MLD38_004608 [Melastoma candidum]|uniref:Uncharacterized protein n=1 Tax=Melastoma candidum TaxID=119954 RepID=A0ACB9S5X4_9MYRT|nr:hypothetical protein MLD38_004608 [Melastoma candidum]
MAVAFVGGAALGAAFGELFRAVMEAKDVVSEFRPQLEKLSSTLTRIRPVIDDTESLNRVLDRVEEMRPIREIMRRGAKLVRKSAKVWKVNVFKKHRYSKKLGQLNDSVEEFFKVDVQAIILRDGKETLVEVKGLSQEMRRLANAVEAGNMVGMVMQDGVGYFVDYVVPQAPDVVIGREAGRCFQEIKGKLLEGGFYITAVSAPGGCGKTTLVTAMCHDEEIKGKFGGNILFIPISKTPNLVDIVQRMALRAGFGETRIESEAQAVRHLRQLLQTMGQRPLLIVLDDVWSNSESLPEKFVVSMLSDFKILVTSRFEFLALGNSHRLKPLDDDESIDLFHRMATAEGNRFGDPNKKVIAQLVDACKGLPLALTVVGKSLRGQPPVKWERKRDELSKGSSLVGSNSEILDCLKKSLDDFDDDPVARECFLDLSSFSEDHKIPADALIDMWMELYDLDSDAHAISILHELSVRSLVNLVISRKDAGESDGFYDGHRVTVHDLLRDLAIMECNQEPIKERKRLIIEVSGSEFPDQWTEQNCMPFNARLAAITTGAMFSSSWPGLSLPRTEVLLLKFCARACSLPDFVQEMGNLKSLLISNQYFRSARLTNFDHIFALSNLKRIRLERVVLPPINPSSVPLCRLRKLSLFMCNLNEALFSCETMATCLMPSLIELNIDYCIDLVKLPAGLCELVHLRKLNITNCHELSELPKIMGNLTQIEVLRLSSCTKLAELPDSIVNLKGLTFLDISNCLKLKKLPDQMGELVNLSKLYMRGCSNLSSIPSSMKRLENLEHVICDQDKEEFFKSMKKKALSGHNNMVIDAGKEKISLDWLYD